VVPFLVLPRTIPAFSSHQPFYFQRLAASWLSFFTSLPLFSIACSLFSQNTRVGGTPAPHASVPPSHAPRSASIPSALISLRILPVTTGVYYPYLVWFPSSSSSIQPQPLGLSRYLRSSLEPRASSLQPQASRAYIRLKGSMSTSTAVSGISFSSRYDMAPLSTLASSERFGDFSRN